MIILASHRYTNPNNVSEKNNIGLCNLIKTIFSVLKIVTNNNFQSNIIHDRIESAYSELYENDLIFRDDTSNFRNVFIQDSNTIKRLESTDKIILTGWRLYNSDVNKVLPIKTIDESVFNESIENSIDMKYNNIPLNIKLEYLDLFKKLNIHKKIVERVNDFVSKYPSYLSVHIRTWKTFGSMNDNRSDDSRYNHYLNNRDNFIKIINSSTQENVFISTDNRDEIQYIVNQIERKNIIFYDKTEACSNLQNDFIDMLLISKGTEIIGSHLSTFTEVAWWYSGCNENIIII